MSHEPSQKKVFLGGTCNDSTWRDNLIPQLNIDYFNPVVPDWTEEAYQEELNQRKICDYLLYVITPKMTGVYSIAEVIDDSNKSPEKTIFCFLTEDEDDSFNTSQIKSLDKVGIMVQNNGGSYCKTVKELLNILNDE